MSLDVSIYDLNDNEVYEYNITHNLTKMADALRVYEELWHPETIGAKTTDDIKNCLKHAIRDLKERPEYYKKYNPKNNWGSYNSLLFFIKDYWKACIRNPNSKIRTST